jgi:hypothetical protein
LPWRFFRSLLSRSRNPAPPLPPPPAMILRLRGLMAGWKVRSVSGGSQGRPRDWGRGSDALVPGEGRGLEGGVTEG